MTTTEHAAKIRAELKAKGITSRQVSVISDLYSMGSAIRIKIKDGSVSLKMVEEIAAPAEHIRRCEASGEILGGGNRFVDVNYSSEALAARRGPYMDAVNRAAEQIVDNALVEIVPGIRLGKNGQNRFSVWSDERHEGECWDLVNVANKVADLVDENGAAS